MVRKRKWWECGSDWRLMWLAFLPSLSQRAWDMYFILSFIKCVSQIHLGWLNHVKNKRRIYRYIYIYVYFSIGVHLVWFLLPSTPSTPHPLTSNPSHQVILLPRVSSRNAPPWWHHPLPLRMNQQINDLFRNLSYDKMIYKKGGKSAAMASLYKVHCILILLHYTYT